MVMAASGALRIPHVFLEKVQYLDTQLKVFFEQNNVNNDPTSVI